MIKASKKQSIIIQYLIWHFFDVPKEIVKAWKNYLVFNLRYFSIFLLLKTFFSHWRKYKWSYGRGLDLKRYFEAFFSNLISRTLGSIIRSFLIVLSLIIEIFIFQAGIIVLLFWLGLPAFLILSLMFSVKLIV